MHRDGGHEQGNNGDGILPSGFQDDEPVLTEAATKPKVFMDHPYELYIDGRTYTVTIHSTHAEIGGCGSLMQTITVYHDAPPFRNGYPSYPELVKMVETKIAAETSSLPPRSPAEAALGKGATQSAEILTSAVA